MRFSGFNDEWKSYRIGDISKTYSGGTPSTSKKVYYYGNIPFIKSGEINKSCTEQYINEDAINNSSAKKVKKGDLLLALYGATSGEVAISKIDGAINQAVLKIDNNMDNYFQYNYFLKYKEKIIHKYLQGGQGNLSANIIKKLEFKFPKMEEQQKISRFLLLIDEKIQLLKKKHKEYQNFKKYLMQQIFTQKLRFDFSDEWNYVNFNNIFKSASTKKYQIKSAEIMANGDFEVIDQGKDEIAGYFNDKNKLCYELPIIIYGDHTTFVKFRDKPFIVGADGVKLLLPKIDSNLKYLFYALEYFNIKPEGYKRHFSIIKKIKLPIPSLEEQNEISEMFSSVDNKLKYTQKQLQETKKFKKGLLQQMFVVRINWRCNFKLAKSPSFNKHLLILKNKIIFIIIK